MADFNMINNSIVLVNKYRKNNTITFVYLNEKQLQKLEQVEQITELKKKIA